MGSGTGRLPVVAAVPNYNMAGNLQRLLPNLLRQGYDDIFVLDDASTDYSVEVVREFAPEVKLIRGHENRGAGANRNQIIDRVSDGVAIHFIDADMDLMTTEAAIVARETLARYRDKSVGAVGGLVTRSDGSQEPHNYGSVFSLWGGFTSGLPLLIDRCRGRPRLAGSLRWALTPLMREWPDLLVEPVAKQAYWLHEGNLLIYSTVFRSVGGYEPAIRAHEAQGLAIRLDRIGVNRWFDPTIWTVHQHIDVRGKNRNKWAYSAASYLIREYGMVRWLTDH